MLQRTRVASLASLVAVVWQGKLCLSQRKMQSEVVRQSIAESTMRGRCLERGPDNSCRRCDLFCLQRPVPGVSPGKLHNHTKAASRIVKALKLPKPVEGEG
jgi:hypothetical protein